MNSFSLAQIFFETLNLVFSTSGASNSKGVTPCEYTPLKTRKKQHFPPNNPFHACNLESLLKGSKKKILA